MAQSARLWYTGVIILHGRRETMMRILNFGSLNLDFTYTVPHFVRPGETLAAEKLEVFAGGKGLNQSTALCRAGAEVFHAGCVGPDGGGLLEQLRQDGADLRFVRTLPGVRTGHTIIQVDGAGQNCILVCGGANRRADAAMAQEVLDAFGPGDWLLLQNEISGLDSILRLAGEKGLHIAFNPSPISPEIRRLPLETVELFLVNEVEGAALGGSGSPEDAVPARLFRSGGGFYSGRRHLYRLFPGGAGGGSGRRGCAAAGCGGRGNLRHPNGGLPLHPHPRRNRGVPPKPAEGNLTNEKFRALFRQDETAPAPAGYEGGRGF